jgi:excinuclease ABC subunit C
MARALGGVRLAGMVKDDKHRTRALIVPEADGGPVGDEAGDGDEGYGEIPLKGKSELYHLVGRIQEEVHRFAVDYHQKRRARAMTE